MTQLRTHGGELLSPLCFGTMQFGRTADAGASRAMYDACRAAGVNHFDTAHVYTGGASETLLGQFIKKERDAIFVATKVAYTGGAGRENIKASFDVSQKRLQLDCIDLLYLHRFDPDTPLSETFDALAQLQRVGKIRHIGVSNYAAWQVVKAQGVAAAMGTRIDMIQPMYSLVKRQAEVELLPMAKSEGIGVAAYSPLGAGLLTGKDTRRGDGRLATDSRYAARYGQPWMHKTAQDFAAFAARMQMAPATLAVAWAARHPSVNCPIISARTVDQLRPSLAAAQISMSGEDYARITALSQTPAPATDRLDEA
ncbi:Predicted oxidoreductase [Octadecabacter temperatus]|uniref:General stress protein 69 n=1 Tax=Octadecabacter temperatus TaxID=1458307 RepID=A0A0K0Y844_9RHOB|nr:aldo/keto reductase [Octadecabacter temperatus]AKS47061.1 General stress protein 69 [Octadecabacter temperatus]SIO46919.1 Predicted oxidoreductase [Octadecabacter temperatus]